MSRIALAIGLETKDGVERMPGPFRSFAALRARKARVAACFAVLCVMGCGRTHYRQRADRDVYGIERERQFDWRWQLPDRPVEADPRSRMRDPFDPDHEPIPPDEPAARPFQVTAGRAFEYHGWKKRGTAPIEDLNWRTLLPTQADGTLLLTPQMAMQVAVINSRDYQTAVENVYLQALSLTLARFQFAIQAFAQPGNQRTFFNHFGAGKTDSNQLQLTTNDGFNLQMMSGAQVLVDFANALVFEYHGKGFQTVTSNLLVNVTQPLFRGAFARIVTQPLSLLERQTLYAIRDFARFRRAFYVNTVAGRSSTGFLDLLNQVQGIKNLENNLQSLSRSLEEYDALVKAGLVSRLQRDLIAQQYQQAQFSLVQAQATLQTSLDAYRIQLGLPPDTPVKIDETLLQTFDLNDPRLDTLRTRNDALWLELLQFESPPPPDVMADAARRLLADYDALRAVHVLVRHEVEHWRLNLAAARGRTPAQGEDKASLERQTVLSNGLKSGLEGVGTLIDLDVEEVRKFVAKLGTVPPEDSLRTILDLVGKSFRGRLSEVFVSQSQIRAFLIELTPVGLSYDQAIEIAFENRLDLKNDQARVTDAWRQVEVDANALRGYLNLVYQGNLATDPKHLGILRFDASNSSQRFGFQFDAPLNRRAERNTYRADQIGYQRARRQYMLTHDTILQQIRLDLRQLNLSRKQFEIGREQLIIASRQVDQAEYELRNSTGAASAAGQSAALSLLSVLNSLLTAKNSLVTSWVNYETARMSLYQDFDTMDIDAQGVWTNEHDGTAALSRRDAVPQGQPLPPSPAAVSPRPVAGP